MAEYIKLNTNEVDENNLEVHDENNEIEYKPHSDSTRLLSHPLQEIPSAEWAEKEEEIVEKPEFDKKIEETNDNEEEKPATSIVLPPVVGAQNDGVFSNLSAKPILERPDSNQEDLTLPPPPPAEEDIVWDNETSRNEELPGYDRIMQEPSPPCFDESVGHARTLSGLNIDDLLVEGLPLGGLISFIWNALVSSLFQYVGFILTYLLHINHAGRLGSLVGLGITLLNQGFTFYELYNNPDTPSISPEQKDEIFGMLAIDGKLTNSTLYLACVLMVVGFIIILRCSFEFVRLRKLKAEVLLEPENGVTQV